MVGMARAAKSNALTILLRPAIAVGK